MKEKFLSIKYLVLHHRKIIMLFLLLTLMNATAFGIGWRMRNLLGITPIIIQKCSK